MTPATQRLIDYLSIPSVSTDPAYTEHVREAAKWTAQQLTEAGFKPEILPTAGHEVILANTTDEMVANPVAPRVLFYGHYDVQPPDPVEKWTTGPFEPTVRDGNIYARGASDDKGQVLSFLEALRGYHDRGEKLPCHVTVFIEGEEECGGKNTEAWLAENPDKLKADIGLVSDTAMWDKDTLTITYALRGLVYFDIKLHGPSRDLHSGVYGGSLANPATELFKVIGGLKDSDNRVTIPGFYDDVADPTAEELEQWNQLGFDEHAFTAEVGSVPFGEKDFSTMQRRWSRPSCDVNGMYGGYMGEGAKTVIPSFAGCKVSFRIPADMQPEKVAKQFVDWLHQHDTGGCRWEIEQHGMSLPSAVSVESPYVKAAQSALQQVTGKPAVLVREGATIPIIGDFKRVLGLDTLLIGFGLNSDNIHSPDEHISLERFELGIKTHTELLKALGNV